MHHRQQPRGWLAENQTGSVGCQSSDAIPLAPLMGSPVGPLDDGRINNGRVMYVWLFGGVLLDAGGANGTNMCKPASVSVWNNEPPPYGPSGSIASVVPSKSGI